MFVREGLGESGGCKKPKQRFCSCGLRTEETHMWPFRSGFTVEDVATECAGSDLNALSFCGTKGSGFIDVILVEGKM